MASHSNGNTIVMIMCKLYMSAFLHSKNYVLELKNSRPYYRINFFPKQPYPPNTRLIIAYYFVGKSIGSNRRKIKNTKSTHLYI